MSAVIEVEYEVDTGTVQQWAQRMPVLVVVNLYRITRTWDAGVTEGSPVTETTTRERVRSWSLPTEEPPAEPSDQGDNTEEQVK